MQRPTRNPSKLKIWRFLDGRPGHENQVKGLCEGISRVRPVEMFDLAIDREFSGLKSLWPGRLSSATKLPKPDLLIGAGHSTHLPLLACRRQFGGRSVVIMKPSLPAVLFDLCLIPAHDRLFFRAGNILRTEGSLNCIRPAENLDSSRGLILLGGPSRHFLWSETGVLDQVRSLVMQDSKRWTVMTSARTPPSFVEKWRSVLPQLPLTVWGSAAPETLPEQLAKCGVVWVTCDSISMIYEALTAGSRVGILELPASAQDRIVSHIRHLTDTSRVTSWSRWSDGAELPEQRALFSEADRCSLAVLQHCLVRESQCSGLTKLFRTVTLQPLADTLPSLPEEKDCLLHATPGFTT
jgi:mitochondrial fission protein ELM1